MTELAFRQRRWLHDFETIALKGVGDRPVMYYVEANFRGRAALARIDCQLRTEDKVATHCNNAIWHIGPEAVMT